LGSSSSIVASASIFFMTEIVRRELPSLNRIDWLMEEKFFRRVRVLSESFIIISE
jgi:hypothetical protein